MELPVTWDSNGNNSNNTNNNNNNNNSNNSNNNNAKRIIYHGASSHMGQ